MWQDGDPVQYVIVGHNLQMMGMTGAGKSIGGAWNFLAEIITRPDAVVLAADMTKGDQTLGPLAPALHRFETTRDGVRDLLGGLHGVVKPRTDYLSGKGLQKWRAGGALYCPVAWPQGSAGIACGLAAHGGGRVVAASKDASARRRAGGARPAGSAARRSPRPRLATTAAWRTETCSPSTSPPRTRHRNCRPGRTTRSRWSRAISHSSSSQPRRR